MDGWRCEHETPPLPEPTEEELDQPEDWIDQLAGEIAMDPQCCDISSSDAYTMARRIRKALDARRVSGANFEPK